MDYEKSAHDVIVSELYESGMGFSGLADAAGVDRERLWRIVAGQRQMNVGEFVRFCRALDLTLEDFSETNALGDSEIAD